MSFHRYIPGASVFIHWKKRFSSLQMFVFLFLLFALSAYLLPQSSAVNAQSASTAFQPTRSSIYGTFYYPWYKNAAVDGTWSYWQDNSFSPPNNWFSNYLPLPPGTKDTATGAIRPAMGLYSSRDKNVFYWQLTKMAKAKLEVSISSWWGRSASATSDNPGTNAVEGKSDFAFRKIITDWMNLADNPYPNLRWTLYYEKEGFADPSVAEIAADLSYINDNYAAQPAFLKISGRPVIFAYGTGGDGCAMVDRWLQARAQTGVNFYLVLKLFSGYANCSSQPDSWHQYAPAVRSGDFSTHSSFISPGFWKVGDAVRLARNLAEFDAAALAMVSANTKWKLVQTWNEWGEGTSIEPGIQVQQSNTAPALVALNASPFEENYIEILSQRFPALQAGTGVAQAATAVPTQPQSTQPPPATPLPSPGNTFTFAAGGDIGANARADASLRAIPPSGASFFLALGDMDYDETASDAATCDYIKQRVGSSFPFEIVTGNHEEGSAASPGPDGYIGNHAACLPDYFASKPVIPGKPAYPANYYFDYPQTNPVMRVIMISANLIFDGVSYNFNKSEQTNYNALAARIDEAKQAGLWVVVGTHKVCLTTGDKSCEIGADLTNLLIQKKVDLVLQGHDHNYQRSKQIALGTSCAAVAPGAYNANCIVDDGSDNNYTRGAGTLFLISGTVGRCCYNVKTSDSEAGYFAKLIGVDGVNTNGFVAYTVSASRIDARVVNAVGTWSDSFSIVAQTAKATPTTPPGPATQTPIASNTPLPPTATVRPTTTAVLPTNTAVLPTPTLVPSATPVTGSTSTLTLTAVADSYVNDASPTTNYGNSSSLLTDASPVQRTYLRFEVPPLSGSIASVTLRVFANTANSVGYTVHGTAGGWGETTLNFTNVPVFGGSVGNSGSISANSWTQVNVTALVTGAGQYNFMMATSSNTQTNFSSRTGANPPQLIVNVAQGPSPSATAILTNTPPPLPSNTSVPPTQTPVPTSTSVLPTATLTPTLPPSTSPTLKLDVLPPSADIGQPVLVILSLQSVSNLYGLQVDCQVNPAILTGTGLTEGDGFNGSTSFIVNTGYQPTGNWTVGASRLLPNPPINGNITAFSLAYTVQGSGSTNVNCTALAVDQNGAELPLTVINSSFTGNGPLPATQSIATATFTPTPLPTLPPTATSTPPPTPIPDSSSVRGGVTYQSRADHSAIKVELYTTAGQFLSETATASDGSFQFSAVPAGEYVVQATANGHLALQLPAVVANDGLGDDLGSNVLRAGDTDGNQMIDLADAAFIGGNFNVPVPPAPGTSDLNTDGLVNIRDLVLIGGNFGLTGPIVAP